MADEIKKMDLRSMDLTEGRIEQLKAIFPEAVTEGKVDFEKLKRSLGEAVESGVERYGMNWAGKSDCFRIIQQPSVGSLKPVRGESVDFDETENLFIEGDNLEVLKLLQKSYYGKIKMIYIDPPYNTGNDFIYPDDYTENLDTYLKYTGQVDAEGRKYSTNTEAEGRFHTKWINMMYPRLYLARNLLRNDGVIFISIDDTEEKNLRVICDEIFGEENFVANVAWQKKYAVSNDDPGIAPMHDHILVYQRSSSFKRNLLPRTDKQLQRYKNLDNDPRGEWSSDNYVSNKSKSERPTLWYPIKHPKTGEDVWPDESAVWRYSKEKHEQIEAEGRLYWGPDMSYEKPRLKRFLSEIQEGVVPSTWWEFEEVGHNDEGQKETAKILGKKIFSTPKPVRLIKRMLTIASDKDSIVLDFFSGSCSSAHAILANNNEDNGKRKFVMIQLPELCDEKSEAYSAGFKTIADIGKERIRRVIQLIADKNQEKLSLDENKLDLGFKVYKLSKSNFKVWDAADLSDPEELSKQLELHVDHVDPESSQEDILYELLLKSGFELTTKVEKIQLEGKDVFSIAEGMFLICLEQELTKEIIRAMADMEPARVICLDTGFKNNDQLKTNAVQIMKSKGVEDFLTV